MEPQLLLPSSRSLSIDSFSSALSFAEDTKSLESRLMLAIDQGDVESVNGLLREANTKTQLLQIVLTKSYTDSKYTFDGDVLPVAIELLGPR